MTKTPQLRSCQDERVPSLVPPGESKVWWTSDQHWGHTNILQYQANTRRFPHIHAMNVAYTDSWNLQVGPNDVVYHLGDFCWGSLKDLTGFMARLKGQIKVIPGNHDKWARQRIAESLLPVSASGYRLEVLDPIKVFRLKEQTIVMCHYPLRSWPHSYYGSWHLHGHAHCQLSPWGLSMDVGVDGSGGSLYSFEGIKEYMEQRRIALESEGINRGNRGFSHEKEAEDDVSVFRM